MRGTECSSITVFQVPLPGMSLARDLVSDTAINGTCSTERGCMVRSASVYLCMSGTVRTCNSAHRAPPPASRAAIPREQLVGLTCTSQSRGRRWAGLHRGVEANGAGLRATCARNDKQHDMPMTTTMTTTSTTGVKVAADGKWPISSVGG